MCMRLDVDPRDINGHFYMTGQVTYCDSRGAVCADEGSEQGACSGACSASAVRSTKIRAEKAACSEPNAGAGGWDMSEIILQLRSK